MKKCEHGTFEIILGMITIQGIKNVGIMIIMGIILAFLTFIFLDISRKWQIIITGCLFVFLILYTIFSGVLKKEKSDEE